MQPVQSINIQPDEWTSQQEQLLRVSYKKEQEADCIVKDDGSRLTIWKKTSFENKNNLSQ